MRSFRWWQATALFTLLLLGVPFMTSAHLDAGQDKVVGPYLIDFGYAPATPVAGESTDIVFNLVDAKSKQSLSPDRVWIRITDSRDAVLFAGTFKPENKNVTFEQRFLAPGLYELTTQFFDAHGLMVTSSFNLPVTASSSTPHNDQNSSIHITNLFLFGLGVGFVGWGVGKWSERLQQSRKRV